MACVRDPVTLNPYPDVLRNPHSIPSLYRHQGRKNQSNHGPALRYDTLPIRSHRWTLSPRGRRGAAIKAPHHSRHRQLVPMGSAVCFRRASGWKLVPRFPFLNLPSTYLPMNTYLCLYRGQKITVQASTSYAAQQEAARLLKARKSYDVSVHLVERADGTTVEHSTSGF